MESGRVGRRQHLGLGVVCGPVSGTQWSPAASAGGRNQERGNKNKRAPLRPQWSPAASAGGSATACSASCRPTARRNGVRPRRPEAGPRTPARAPGPVAAMESGRVGRRQALGRQSGSNRPTCRNGVRPRRPEAEVTTWCRSRRAARGRNGVRPRRPEAGPRPHSRGRIHQLAAMESGRVGRRQRSRHGSGLAAQHVAAMESGRVGRRQNLPLVSPLAKTHTPQWSPAASAGGSATTPPDRTINSCRNGVRPRRPEAGLGWAQRDGELGAAMESGRVGRRQRGNTSRSSRRPDRGRNGVRPRRPEAAGLMLDQVAYRMPPQWSPAASAGGSCEPGVCDRIRVHQAAMESGRVGRRQLFVSALA